MTGLFTQFLVAFGLAVGLTPLCRAVAHRLGYVARPKEDRWHKTPTALLGGVAIVLSTLAASLASGTFNANLWELAACSVFISAVGLFDDLRSLKPSTKLIAQIIAASALLFLGFRLNWTESLAGDAMLTLFWVVGVTNAFNLLDNMDGLCGGVMLIAGAFLLVGLRDQPDAAPAALYLATMLGATAGFLIYNLHPASIFMGDAGSLFLGLNVAALTLSVRMEADGGSRVLSVVAAPVLLLLIPILDTTLVTAMRLLSGRRPSQGGRDHASHRLVAIGLSEPRAVTTLWMLAGAGGLISLLLQQRDQSWSLIVAIIFVLSMIIFAVYLARIRVYGDTDPALVRDKVTPLVVDFMFKRRVAEVLLDLCLVPLAYYTAYRLRFEGRLLPANYPLFLNSLPVVLSCQLLALFIVGGYRGTWRYFGMMDAVVFAKGVLLGTVGAQLIILYAYRFQSYSRAVFVIDAALLFLMLSGSRASFRLIGEFVNRRSTGRRCIIYGTGDASLATIQQAFGAVPFKIIGFIDDSPMNRHTRVAGYPVLGGLEVLQRLIAADEVDCVVLNTHLVAAERLVALEAACLAREVELLRLNINLVRLSAVS
jgi:UDP-GlcNAc:undecaprenyl-phosphate/decaprenyl-phosphate GlcNAc-1-phosphate transferase